MIRVFANPDHPAATWWHEALTKQLPPALAFAVKMLASARPGGAFILVHPATAKRIAEQASALPGWQAHDCALALRFEALS